MKIAKADFQRRFKEKQLTIALIGMSGMGKSYRAKQLQELGFSTYGCDDEIAKRISSLLPTEDVGGLAAWMGQPYAEGYKVREQQYLVLEEEVTRAGLEARLQHQSPEALLPDAENRVLDTTGSVIYCSPGLQQELKQKTVVVYLESSQEVRDALFEVYMRDPKPVVWGDSFVREEGENDHDALARCYPRLLEYRARRYAALADSTLPYAAARDPLSSGADFLEVIKNHLL
ncbi:MAG: hypothetical protein A2542_03260 [Parcubacteria group bacterium RIFOXYD2_FULL_52_8]|nr:MAG: hypothetical protein A2542_03260 [Parcubacteria group bacterium RIFOXYD2_FULL_52_8]